MNNDNKFLKGTAILTISGICVKLLSAAYRIPITRMIGAQGMGHYSATFNIFMPFFSFAVAGITPTVSRLCAREKSDNYGAIINIKKTASLWFGLFSVLMASIALIVSKIYSEHIESPLLFIGVLIMCPNLIMASFEAIYRGISQGTLNMTTSANSGVLESGAKVVIGVFSVYMAGKIVKNNPEDVQLYCAFITVTISGFICWYYLHHDFYSKYSKIEKSNKKINYKVLFSMSLPIAFSALVVSLANFFDTVICLSIIKQIPDNTLMQSYPFISFSAESEKAIWLFGVYQGLCLSVTNLIPSMSSAIGSRGLPLITKSVTRGDSDSVTRQSEKLIKITAAIVIPISMFVSFFSYEVLTTIYGDRGAQTELAAYFIKIMAPVAALAAFSFPLNSVLHASQKSAEILKILIFACVIKVISSVILCSIGSINIMGCIYSQVIFQLIVFYLSVRAVKQSGNDMKVIRNMVIPFVLSYVLVTFVRSLRDFVLYNMPTVFNTFLCGSVFVILYIVTIVFVGFFIDKQMYK